MNQLFVCPVCRETLKKDERTFHCSNGHSFDISKQGYVNLLQSQQSSLKRHGDDKTMVRARREFLEKGYYRPLRDLLCAKLCQHTCGSTAFADAGCGEGYYTRAMSDALLQSGKLTAAAGIDISKHAAGYAAKADSIASYAVASVFDMP